MAIITCPECGKEISSRANSCPNCGYSFLKKKSTILVCKISFCVVNLLYLFRRFSLKMIITTNVADLFWDYADNREIDNYDAFDFISPLQFASTISTSNKIIYDIIIVLMIVAFIVSIIFIIKNKFIFSIVSFSAIPILSELFFILADGVYIETAVQVSTSPFDFSTLKYILFGIMISIIELIIYKKVILPLTNKPVTLPEQFGLETDVNLESGE